MGTVDPDSTNALHRALQRERRLERRLSTIEARLDSAQQALDLKAEQYDRHFVILNNEAERILAAQNASVSRQIYDRDRAQDAEWRASVDRSLTRVQLIAVMIVLALSLAAPFALRLTGS